MAEIVLGLAASHGSSTFAPSSTWGFYGERDKRKPYYEEMLAKAGPAMAKEASPEKMEEKCQAGQRAQAQLDEIVTRTSPDVIVVFGDDQHEQFHEDNMPMFCVYRGAAMERGERRRQRDDWKAEAGGTAPPPKRVFEGAPALADHLIERLVEAGIDLACSNALKPAVGLGHAFTHVAENMPSIGERPMLPFMVNTYYPPNQPTASRAYALGQAVRDAIEAWDSDLRVAVMASGGLSHQRIDEELDRAVLDAMERKRPERLRAIPGETLQGGTSEILNWITVAGAMEQMAMTVVDYVPAYRTPAGTGLAMGFAYWTRA